MRKYRPKLWRSLLDVILCWLSMFLLILITLKVSWWLYPLTALLLANRLLALSLICHEGLHGNIASHEKVNDFIGRYLCAFPACISFSKYRRVHLLHHQGVGSEQWDPDRHLYSYFPLSANRFFITQIKELLTFRTSYSFLVYYTELIEWIKGTPRHKSSDLKGFVFFHVTLLAAVISLGYFWHYLLFLVIPLTLITQPYVLLMGGLQHGPVRETSDPQGVSRTISGSKFYMWLLLPLDINYHAEHHRNAGVPHYYLKRYAEDLKQEGVLLWEESYLKAVKNLFADQRSLKR